MRMPHAPARPTALRAMRALHVALALVASTILACALPSSGDTGAVPRGDAAAMRLLRNSWQRSPQRDADSFVYSLGPPSSIPPRALS